LLVRIGGNSMLPAYREGDFVLVDAGAYVDLPPRPGDVVLVAHPYQTNVRMVKRVQSITPEGRVFVVGDNPGESTDSRSFGPLRPSQIVGKLMR
jgi:nickel-type superoxide dismutase maturation protease